MSPLEGAVCLGKRPVVAVSCLSVGIGPAFRSTTAFDPFETVANDRSAAAHFGEKASRRTEYTLTSAKDQSHPRERELTRGHPSAPVVDQTAVSRGSQTTGGHPLEQAPTRFSAYPDYMRRRNTIRR